MSTRRRNVSADYSHMSRQNATEAVDRTGVCDDDVVDALCANYVLLLAAIYKQAYADVDADDERPRLSARILLNIERPNWC